MVIQRETMFLINLIFTELFRCNITIKMFYKYLPIFYSVQHYIYVCVLTYSLVVSKRFFYICSFFLVIYVDASQIYSEFSGISSWINFELKLLFSVYLIHTITLHPQMMGSCDPCTGIPLGPSREESNLSDI